jgi:hypothetical protein
MRLKALMSLFALALVTTVLLLVLFVGGAAGGHGKGKGHNNASGNHGRIGYHFLVADQIAGAPDRMIVQGDGSFNRNRANGGGTFDWFLAGTGPPATLIATGTWKAEDVVSWSPGLSHGVFEGGTLVIHATFRPVGQPVMRTVTIMVDCNLGPAGFNTGRPEGITVTLPNGTTFIPTSPTTGVTIFSLNKGHKH